MSADEDRRIRDQIEFYRVQAGVYPQEANEADGLLMARCGPSRHCLELASGAGRWTQHLVKVCDHLTAVDASPEMHRRNRALNGDDRVEYVVADLFGYRPPERYDLIFAGSWLSHVPADRFDTFWHTLATALAPGGRVVMVDDGVVDAQGNEHFASDPSGVSTSRQAVDGRAFEIVKIAYAPGALRAQLHALGWHASITLLTPESYLLEATR